MDYTDCYFTYKDEMYKIYYHDHKFNKVDATKVNTDELYGFKLSFLKDCKFSKLIEHKE